MRTVCTMERILFASLKDVLPGRLSQTLPGINAHLTMAPASRTDPDQLIIQGKPCRSAGVMALLFPYSDGAPGLILTKRREDLPEHAGQIAFPGGRQENEESLVQTALRETEEEIGLSPSRIQMLGPLSPLYINVSNYCVYPFVGLLDEIPSTLKLEENEVHSVLKISISQLAAPQTRREEIRTIRGQRLRVPYYAINNEVIWGATAMILAELLMVLHSQTITQ